MRKEKKNINIFAIILGVSMILALVLFLSLDVATNSVFGSVAGFNSVFGIATKFADGHRVSFNWYIGDVNLHVNGVGITLLVLFLVSAVFSGILGDKKRGFFIASTVVDVALIALIFTYHSSWFNLNCSDSQIANKAAQGIGEILSGIIVIIHAIANIVAFKLVDTKKR